MQSLDGILLYASLYTDSNNKQYYAFYYTNETYGYGSNFLKLRTPACSLGDLLATSLSLIKENDRYYAIFVGNYD